MGLALDPVDLLRAEMKEPPRLAKAPTFQTTAEWIGGLVNRQPAPWKRRKGVVYFHNVSIVKYLAPHFGASASTSNDERMFQLLGRLQDEVRTRGLTLVYIDSIPDQDGRLPLILLPTSNKYAALVAYGTNGINKGLDTDALARELSEARSFGFWWDDENDMLTANICTCRLPTYVRS